MPDLCLPEPVAGSYFVATYPPFSCWNEAGAREFRAELEQRQRPDAPLGIYLHVPFCVERCQFCYYLSYDERGEEIDTYVQTVLREAETLGAMPAIAGRDVAFAYIGGGTPSILSTSRLERLLDGLRRALRWDALEEFSFECAPRTVTAEKLRLLRDHGVTRLSMGVQQMNDEILRRNGRAHGVVDIERAWKLIQAADFDVVNLDLIVGLVAETDDTFHASLDRLIEMSPESITLYQLEIPLNTPLYRALEAGDLEHEPATWAVKRRRLNAAFDRLEQAGYTLRSAYTAARTPEAAHFMYQDSQYAGADLLGLGASSFSSLGAVQHQNRADLEGYLGAATRQGLALWRGKRLSADEQAVREMLLQWKLGRVDRIGFCARHGIDPMQRFGKSIAALVDEGLARITEKEILLTRTGLLNTDRVLPAFYLPEHRDIRYS